MSTYPIIEWDDQYPTEESVAALRAWFEADRPVADLWRGVDAAVTARIAEATGMRTRAGMRECI